MATFPYQTLQNFRLVWSTVYANIFARPSIFIIFLLMMSLIILVLQWLFSLETLRYILSGDNGLTVGDKIEVLIDAFSNVFKFANGIVPISFILIACLQSAAIVLLWRIRKQYKIGTSIRSLFWALLGSGCVACGGSVLTPLLSIVASSVSVVFAERLGQALLLLSVFLSYRALLSVCRALTVVRSV